MKKLLDNRLRELERALGNLGDRLEMDREVAEDMLEQEIIRIMEIDDPQRDAAKHRRDAAMIARLMDSFRPSHYEAVVLESTIQCFEICYELFSKCVRQFLLEVEGELPEEVHASPRMVFKKAYQTGIIGEKYERTFSDMNKDRQDTTHTYVDERMQEIVSNLHDYHAAMRSVYADMKRRVAHSKRAEGDD